MALDRERSNSKTTLSQATNSSPDLANLTSRCASRSRRRSITGSCEAVLETAGPGTKDYWSVITGFGENWRAAVRAEETVPGAEATGAWKEIFGEVGTQLAIAVDGTLNDAGRGKWETIAGGTFVKVAAKIADTVYTGRLAATIAAGVTGERYFSAAVVIGEAARTGSMKEEDETDGGRKNE